MNLKQIELLELRNSAYINYKLGTGGNSDLTFEEVRRKLTRNVKLAKPERINESTIIFHYGNLKIYVYTKTNEIYKVKNTYSNKFSWGKNYNEYEKLNKKLEIV